MKKLTILLILFSICFLPLSCGGETKNSSSYDQVTYEDEKHSKQDKGTVKFLLDGEPWINDGEDPHNGLNVDAITDHQTIVQLKGHASDGTYMDLVAYNAEGVGPGTYILGSTSQGTYQSDTEDKILYITAGMREDAGTVTIESLTETRVTGRFAFKMRSSVDPFDIKVVTEGVFDVEFN